MSARLVVLGLGPVFALAIAATSAHAQAPGEVYPEVAPAPAPVVIDPCGGRPSVMAHRFAIGLNLGGFSVAPETADSGDTTADTNFHTSELSLRYRATLHLELELALTGGRQVLDDDSDGDLAMGGGTLGARYRFRPEQAWNWWLMGGLGATVIERHDSTAEQRDAATRPHVALGIGLERRFRRFALQAEARMLAIGERKDAMDAPVVNDTTGAGTMPLPPDAINPVRNDKLSGGTFTFGASFYF
jgi:hypothetical protein